MRHVYVCVCIDIFLMLQCLLGKDTHRITKRNIAISLCIFGCVCNKCSKKNTLKASNIKLLYRCSYLFIFIHTKHTHTHTFPNNNTNSRLVLASVKNVKKNNSSMIYSCSKNPKNKQKTKNQHLPFCKQQQKIITVTLNNELRSLSARTQHSSPSHCYNNNYSPSVLTAL